MSQFSIQGSPSLSIQPVIEKDIQKPVDFPALIQEAAAENNIEAILIAVRAGGNPNHEIAYTPEVAMHLTLDYVAVQLDCDQFREACTQFSEETTSLDPETQPTGHAILERLRNKEEVSDSELQKLSASLLVKEAFEAQSSEFADLKVTPLTMALANANFEAAHELVQLGADLSHPRFESSLEALIMSREYESIIDFLEDHGVREEKLDELDEMRDLYETEVLGVDLLDDFDFDVSLDLEALLSQLGGEMDECMFDLDEFDASLSLGSPDTRLSPEAKV